jgi:septal ring factor EnvC (AmiA/AmiB activator)
VAVLAAALSLGACGKDEGDPIPAGQAQALIRGLDTAQRQADNGACSTLLNTTIPALEKRAQRLKSTVGSDVRTTIQDGVAQLRQLATDQCTAKQQQQQPTTSDTTTSETTTSETTTSDTTTTDTTTSDTTTDTAPPPTDTGTTTTVPPPTVPGNGGTPPAQGNGAAQP